MNVRLLLLRLPRRITTIPRQCNMKLSPRLPARWMYMFGFPASGNGAAAGYGLMAIGRLARILALFGSVAAGFGADIIASGPTAAGVE